MSFKEQERALFDLLFDESLRQQFKRDKKQALKNYDLSPAELHDFSAIRCDALSMDADMRKQLLLSQFSNLLPLSFSLVSSLPDGITLLQGLIDSRVMKSSSAQRLVLFTQKLCHEVESGFSSDFNSALEKQNLLNIIATELAMAISAADLKQDLLAESHQTQIPIYYEEEHENWQNKPLQLAQYVSANTINQPYSQLKKKLCPKNGTALWRHLKDHPLPVFLREESMAIDDGRLLVSKACVTEDSSLDPVVDHITVELVMGFAPMFQYIDGTMSVLTMLKHLVDAGAPETLLNSVKSGFYQLLQCGMLVLEPAETS
ncbi:MAG: hypothetical protein HRU20_17395 [Pseudomonadales bacterium]|nr:hypothetical protein [Pseudomonadales bacterium]